MISHPIYIRIEDKVKGLRDAMMPPPATVYDLDHHFLRYQIPVDFEMIKRRKYDTGRIEKRDR